MKRKRNCTPIFKIYNLVDNVCKESLKQKSCFEFIRFYKYINWSRLTVFFITYRQTELTTLQT